MFLLLLSEQYSIHVHEIVAFASKTTDFVHFYFLYQFLLLVVVGGVVDGQNRRKKKWRPNFVEFLPFFYFVCILFFLERKRKFANQMPTAAATNFFFIILSDFLENFFFIKIFFKIKKLKFEIFKILKLKWSRNEKLQKIRKNRFDIYFNIHFGGISPFNFISCSARDHLESSFKAKSSRGIFDTMTIWLSWRAPRHIFEIKPIRHG